MLELNQIYNMDCMEGMKRLSDKSINLILIDPPYNIGKAKWDKIPNYIEWMGKVFTECERVLKDNGSLYWFHNNVDAMAELVLWLKYNTKFILKQLIVWNKKFNGAKNEGYLQGFNEVEGLRNYQKMAEYCLFYTFQDETGLETIFNSRDCFNSVKGYMRKERRKLMDEKGMKTFKEFAVFVRKLTNTSSVVDRHYFADSQWTFPTKGIYSMLQSTGHWRREYEDLRREYEDLRREYEDLRREYEDLRYTFNNQKTHHSVWNYEVAKKTGHITPKPVELIENIIIHSSNKGDVVLDCFMGSGTTGVACINTQRNYIGFEIDKDYYKKAKERLEAVKSQIKLAL